MPEALPGPRPADVLLLEAARGSRDAFAAFVAETRGSVYRLALAITGNPADAEDILQETYLASWRAASNFRGESSALTWVLTIARNAAYRNVRHRTNSTHFEEPALERLGFDAGWGSDDPERIASRAQDRENLQRALAVLAEPYREIIALRDLEGIPGESVAAALGMSLPAMKSRLHRARLALAAALREEGFHG